jgi:hypothetical protein
MAVIASDGTIQAAVPLIGLPDRRYVSLPFSDLCHPLARSEAAGGALLAFIEQTVSKERGGPTFELRGDGGLDPASRGFEAGGGFYQHVIDLARPWEAVEGGFNSAVRRGVRKAERDDVTVTAAATAESMMEFYELVKKTRRKQQLLPQPARFFEQIRLNLPPGEASYLLLAKYRGQTIAGDLLLRFGDSLLYKFNASDHQFLALRPNNLLLASAIRLGHDLGCKEFDLGRCDLDGEGLRRFKLSWGSREEVVRYYYYPRRPPMKQGLTAVAKRKLLPRFVRHAPSWALGYAGNRLYKGFA